VGAGLSEDIVGKSRLKAAPSSSVQSHEELCTTRPSFIRCTRELDSQPVEADECIANVI